MEKVRQHSKIIVETVSNDRQPAINHPALMMAG
nr:MAG: hypothetical protein [Bacteriophage sp.]UWH99815.1 MAG: hypothetical protein [Bacteriophage sp.]